jgi:hypothetical protein
MENRSGEAKAKNGVVVYSLIFGLSSLLLTVIFIVIDNVSEGERLFMWFSTICSVHLLYCSNSLRIVFLDHRGQNKGVSIAGIICGSANVGFLILCAIVLVGFVRHPFPPILAP